LPSSTHFPTTVPGRSLYPKILSGKRTPRKRNLSSLDQDMVATPLEARGHVRGAKEMSRGGSTTAREQSKARHLNGELVDLKHFLNVGTRFDLPQAFLSSDFQCRNDISAFK